MESLKLESFTEVGKSQAKLERTEQSWKEPSEVGKNQAKLERTKRSEKVSLEVGKFWLKLESLNGLGKCHCRVWSKVDGHMSQGSGR